MAPTSGLFRGCRALYAAAKSAAAPSPKPNISASSNKPAAAAAGTKDKKSSPTGLLKAKPVSPTLRNFVGASEISRAEALKKVWGYIKLHNLQLFSLDKDRKFKTVTNVLDENVRESEYMDTLSSIHCLCCIQCGTRILCVIEANVDLAENPSNKKEIFCDGKLKALFNGKEKVGFLEITKLLSPHFVNN